MLKEEMGRKEIVCERERQRESDRDRWRDERENLCFNYIDESLITC
jgi:hypothetical protein